VLFDCFVSFRLFCGVLGLLAVSFLSFRLDWIWLGVGIGAGSGVSCACAHDGE